MEPQLSNERARREWQYLIDRVGAERAQAAIAQIPGHRRPFPLNIAKVLGIEIPPESRLPWPDEDKERLREVGLKNIARIRGML